ncbi:hypothetical protein BDV30DRAFT_205096 [Aspergillus minisclerotigenes]|uniref:Uncharacterized protein n=1 Tax=Aspergillus minisclerotigenes TaxID=656917 RepID=A0A5N6JEY1_9EURO|nr:hypothetical protein BDV30DRAFT_205096 [Aspergillus minisclerotigenes]
MRYHDSTRQCRLQKALNLNHKVRTLLGFFLAIPMCLASACSVSKFHPDRQAGKVAHSVGLLAYDTLSFNQK